MVCGTTASVPGISHEKLSSSKIPLWLNLRGIPMELFTNEGISHIASGVGVSLLMNKATELKNRLSFARFSIEVDLIATLPSSINVEIEDFGGLEVVVDYPLKPKFCTICREIGHGDKFCHNSKEVWKPIQ